MKFFNSSKCKIKKLKTKSEIPRFCKPVTLTNFILASIYSLYVNFSYPDIIMSSKHKHMFRGRLDSIVPTYFEQREKISLHKILKERGIVQIHNEFLERDNRMDRRQLSKVLADVADLHYNEKEFEILFLKININRYVESRI